MKISSLLPLCLLILSLMMTFPAAAHTGLMNTPPQCADLSNQMFASGPLAWCEAYTEANHAESDCNRLPDKYGGNNDNGSSPYHVCLGIRQALLGQDCGQLSVEGGQHSYNSSPRDVCQGFRAALDATVRCETLVEEWGEYANTSSPLQVCQGVRAALKRDVPCAKLSIEFDESDATSSPKQICEGLSQTQ